MTNERIVTVGAPPTFRQQVALALGRSPEGVEWAPGIESAEELLAAMPGGADLVALSPGVREPDALAFAEVVSRRYPVTALVLVRDETPNGTLPSLVRAGFRDVVDLTRGGGDLHESLTRALTWSSSLRGMHGAPRQEDRGGRGVVVTVFSSKGGTGKTFVACNLAAGLAARTRRDTAVVDFDLDMGDVFAYFGSEPAHPLQDLVALDEDAERETVRETGSKLADHLWGYASPADPTAGAPSGESMARVLRTMRNCFDFTIVDGTCEYADHVLAAFDASDAVLLVSGLDIVGARHLSLAIQTLLSVGVPKERLRVILNRADSKVGLSPADVERVMNIKVDAMIPSSRDVPTSLNRGRPIVLTDPKSAVSKSVLEIADFVGKLTPTIGERFGAGPRRRGLLLNR